LPADALSEISHPLLRQLLAFWSAKRGERLAPARADFDVAELKDWLGNLMLIEVIEGGAEFRYRVYGSVLAAYYGHDFTGKTTAVVRPEARELVRAEYGEVCRTRRPLVITRERDVRHAHRTVVKLILPLSGDGTVVDMLLVGSYPL
jgi:hypothetical protein